MKTKDRKIIVTFTIPDSNEVEQKLFKIMDSIYDEENGKYMTDFKKLPDTSELYDKDPTYKKLCQKYKEAKNKKNEYEYIKMNKK